MRLVYQRLPESTENGLLEGGLRRDVTPRLYASCRQKHTERRSVGARSDDGDRAQDPKRSSIASTLSAPPMCKKSLESCWAPYRHN
jgi:hypothetical protein